MYKLTGKCKEDFETYLESSTNTISMYSFRGYPESCQNALIIEWLDSVCINIEINIDVNNNANSCDEYCENCGNCYDTWNPEYKYCIYVFKEVVNNTNDYSTSFSETNFETRTEALESAIVKANEIYNSKDENFDKPLKDVGL